VSIVRALTRGLTRFGRYELLVEIGRGGMAELFLARLTARGGFEKLVAIKRILPHLSLDERFVAMFLNEGKIAARLAHPNVCQVFELGDVDGELFLAMEYLEGVSLDELTAALPPDPVLRVRLAANVIVQACEGLHYAHELRDALGAPTPVVHRDISPHNLFVTVEGVCKLLDFGVSKVVTDADQTRSGLIKGKLTYMPPEQVRSEAIDARVDVFAMGVVLWELLAGERLFLRDSDFLILKAIMEDPTPSVRTRQPALSDELDAVLMRALERDRAQRTPTIRALADQLLHAAAPFGGLLSPGELAAIVRAQCSAKLADRSRLLALREATRVEPPPAAAFQPEPSVTHSVQLRGGSISLKSRPPRRRWLPFAAVGAAVAIAGGVVLAMRAPAPEVSPPAPAPSPVASAPPIDAAEVRVDAAPPEEIEMQPPVDTAPAPRPKPRPAPAPSEPGFYSVDSDPYATIYIDGKRIDQTPLFKRALPSGTHRVRAVREDGKSRTFTIRISPGQHVSSGTLTW
jgi:serine/threonine-protein kinase